MQGFKVLLSFCPEMLILCSWRCNFRVHDGDESIVQDIFLARSASQIHALNKVVADPESDSEDDFYGEWCDEDGNFNLHGGDVGCVHDSQSLLLQSDDLWLDQVAFNNWLKMFTVSVKNTWLGILLYIYIYNEK